MERRPDSRDAFTLVELLVAMAVFALILGILLSLISSTSSLTNSSQAKMETGAKLRQILDRLSADFRSAIMRKDLAPLFQKAKGNDALYFYAASDGYGGERGVCTIGYRIRNDHLERGAQGADWSTNAVAFAQDLVSSDFVANPANKNYDTLGEHVFRLEIEFLLKDGNKLTSTPPANWDKVEAVVVNLATIDQWAYQKAHGSLSDLSKEFEDAGDTADTEVMEVWSKKLLDPNFINNDPNFPGEIKRGLNIRRRTFSIVSE